MRPLLDSARIESGPAPAAPECRASYPTRLPSTAAGAGSLALRPKPVVDTSGRRAIPDQPAQQTTHGQPAEATTTAGATQHGFPVS